MRKTFILILLGLVCSVGNVWATQTDLISGVTLPDIPSATLDLTNQDDFEADNNGWIVFGPSGSQDNVVASNYWNGTTNTTGAQWTVPDGAVAPFKGNTSGSNINVLGVQQTSRTHALRFTGAEVASFLVHSGGSRTIYVALFSYDGEKQSQVTGSPKNAGNAVTELYYDGLTKSTNYIAYFYESTNSNGRILEVALKGEANGPFAVSYNSNGGTGTLTDANSPYAKNTTVTVLANSFTAPSGKSFDHWNTKADDSGISYDADDTITPTEDVTLYAQWVYPATGTGTVTYTLTKGKNEVSGSVTGVSKLTASETSFSTSTLEIGTSNAKDGYSGQITGHAAAYSASQYVALSFTVASGYVFTPISVGITVFANSTSNMKTKVELTDGVTSVVSNELSCASSADSDVEFADGAFTGKKFEGTVTVKVYQWGVTSKRAYIKSPVTISGTVAVAPSKYNVEFAKGEGTGSMDTRQYFAGVTVTAPASTFTAPANKTFSKWSVAGVDGTTEVNADGTFTMPENNVTLTAQWAQLYTITYNLNGGTGTPPSESSKVTGATFTVASGTTGITAPSGKQFANWNDGTNDYDPDDTYTVGTSNVTLTAVWENLKCATPVITPADGSSFVSASQEVMITCATDGAKIYYTTDGTTPSSSSTEYTAAFNISSTTTVKAVAINGVNDDSEITSATITKVNSITMSSFTSSSITTSPATADLGISLNGSEWGKDAHVGEIKFRWGGNKFTITSAAHSIVALKLTYTTDGEEPVVSVSTGSYNATAKMWSGSASSITFTNSATSSDGNAYISEIIVYYESSSTIPYVVITPAYAKTTYVTSKNLDFTSVSGLKAYVATSASAAGVVMTELNAAVPTATPLLLIGTASTTYYVPVAESASAPASNLLEAGDGTTIFDGTTPDYILYSDGLFYQIGSGTVATDKAYLHLDSAPGAAGLRILLEEENATNIESIEATDKAVKFIENGKLYIKKNNIVYDAMGRVIR